jgi:hypothetical protein
MAQSKTLSNYEARMGLTLKEANLLRLLLSKGSSLAKGTTVAASLAQRGFLTTSPKLGRWTITTKGQTAVAGLTPRNP